ncbi:hypothetical protein SAMN05421820_107201 [Pedobacter steynii]|uniref:Uncharacterized protein n=2 Tax=Pedobacter steynii TaxID=430522 RepID=A0A1H0ATM0_9SPHI|nr:hypothetical protein SAMN05421820_107201 [Pedobacter steynii]
MGPLKIILFTIVLSVVGYIGYVFLTFDLLTVENERIRTVRIYGKPYALAFYRVNGNATVQSGIQIRKIQEGEEHLLKHYDRYNSIAFLTVGKGVLKIGLKEDGVEPKVIDSMFLTLP